MAYDVLTSVSGVAIAQQSWGTAVFQAPKAAWPLSVVSRKATVASPLTIPASSIVNKYADRFDEYSYYSN